MAGRLMLVPSTGCPARCKYCFGPSGKGEVMSDAVLGATADWVASRLGGDARRSFEIVFHGGEPLSAGAPFFRRAFTSFSAALPGRELRLSVQSNLWLLDDELCELFAAHGVSLGTSLDGPEAITDAQRGQGYFRRTMAGIERARRYGLGAGCICTFTAQSALRTEEIFEFFAREGLEVSVHAAVPPLAGGNGWTLGPEAFGELLVRLLERYLSNLHRLRISTLDGLCRAVHAGEGSVCSFRECFGEYLAVAPDGGIYPCQRFANQPRFRLGRVDETPGPTDLETTPVGRMFRSREDNVGGECGGCVHFAYCKGGCPYDALAASGGVFRSLKDPYCPAYRRVFSYLTDRALEELFEPENLRAEPMRERGPLLGLMRGEVHPREAARHARTALYFVALGTNQSAGELAPRLAEAGVALSAARAAESLARAGHHVQAPRRLNNLYLHVTYGCNRSCAHCYAQASPARAAEPTMAVEGVLALCRQAAAQGFRQVVITGGEPLVHPDRDQLLDSLAALRAEIKPALIMLRTNLAQDVSPELARRLEGCADKIAVSVDGDEALHDARRGTGAYRLAVEGLRALREAGGSAEVLLSTVLPVADAHGPAGESVRTLARTLGIARVHFRPLLPLGRAGELPGRIERESPLAYTDPAEVLGNPVAPALSCGLGVNLYVAPSGESFPCYALSSPQWSLGNTLDRRGLGSVVASPGFRRLGGATVETNRQCHLCALRYLCGGACRAWGRATETDLDAAPADCLRLHRRARELVLAALECLRVSPDRWLAAGLPLPESPPTP
jgi:uncharacterized protein